MDGKIIEKLESWIINSIKDQSWKKFNDFHINDIDKKFNDPNLWIRGGIELFVESLKIRDKLNIQIVIELMFSLKSKKIPTKSFIKSTEKLKLELDWSPPSLYIFKPNWDVWKSGIILRKEIVLNDLHVKNAKFYYYEYLSTSNEFNRVVIVSSLPNTF